MSDIPLDVRREILLRLPAKSVIRFRAVCKLWLSIIDNPCFAKAHISKQLSSNSTILIRNSTGHPFHPLCSFDLESLDFTNGLQTIRATLLNSTRGGFSRVPYFPLTACNGLILVAPSIVNRKRVYWTIWNPLTHEVLELPRGEFCSDRMFNGLTSGIGYDYASDDYKVVVIDCPGRLPEKYVFETHVYSLKSDSWKKIINRPCGKLSVIHNGVFLSGALHWISMRDVNNNSSNNTNNNKIIIVFDLGTESYLELRMPPFHGRDRYNNEMVMGHQHLDVLGGCLIVSGFGKDDYDFKHYDVWVMKDYGAQNSWVKLFSVNEYDVPALGFDLRPVAYMKNKLQIFMQDAGDFYFLDVESNSMKAVSVHGLAGILTVQVYHGSILRLNDNCGFRRCDGRERRMEETKSKRKMADIKLTFCVRDADSWDNSLDECCSSTDSSNWYYSSSEDELE